MTTRRTWMIALLSGGIAPIALAAQTLPVHEAASVESVRVPIASGSVSMMAQGLDGATAVALPADAFAPDKHGLRADDFPSLTLTSRVIVRTSDLARLRADATAAPAQAGAIAAQGNAVWAHDQVRGFAVVEAGTVRAALELADRLRAGGAYETVELEVQRPITKRSAPTDPLLSDQWHLRNTQLPNADINADGAWDLGYTGQGVVIGIVEDGFQQTHPDIAPNYNATASQGSPSSADRHATACAGIAAARGNNGVGVAGLAYLAGISQQFLGSSSQNASAFTFRNDLNDVKSNSWGPFDNGWLWDITAVEIAALQQAAEDGRGGLGTNVCWAAGNGGTGDRVDYDPYASSRFTLSIGSVGDFDVRASYNELGSSHLVVTHSSGNNRGTTTVDLVGNSGYNSGDYTFGFGGTSSASPLGAGAVALALEANPGLSYRDVQYLLIETARKNDAGNPTWETNAAGHDISYDYGFGAIDAETLVAAAALWTNVPEQVSASSGVESVDTAIPDNNATGVTRSADVADDITIEAVELVVNIDTTYRGDLDIILTAPSGTESVLSTGGRGDSQDDIVDYTFTSFRHWGEQSAGTWTVKVADRAGQDFATWVDFEVRVHGTVEAAGCQPADLAEPFDTLDIFDVLAYLDLFDSQDPGADLAEPMGVFDIFDVLGYLAQFDAGC